MKTKFVTITGMLITALVTVTAFADDAQPQQMNNQMQQTQPMPAPSDTQNAPLQTSSTASTTNDANNMTAPQPSAPNSN